jgi:iron(III) transport system permease protein
VSRLRGWRAGVAFGVTALPVLFGFLLPAGALLHWAGATYRRVINVDFLVLLGNSLMLAIVTALLALVLALYLAYGKRLGSGAWTRLTVRLVSLGYAVPGTVIAVGALVPLAWLDNQIDAWLRAHLGLASGLLLSGTLFVLVYAYLVRFLAVSISTVEAGLAKIQPSLDEAAHSLGASPAGVLARVHVPIMRGTLCTAALLVFVDVLKELPATLLLRPFNFNTLAVRTYELANEERLAEAACPALAIVLAGIIPVILLSRASARSRPGHGNLS